MAFITTTVEVEVYPDEFDDDDLIDEITSRGYEVYNKGEVKKSKDDDLKFYDKTISDLYNTYMTCSPELFEKELKKLFREHLGANIY